MSSLLFPSKLYTYPEAAAALGVSPLTLRRWVSQKKIESSKVGGRVVFRPEQLEAAIEPNDRPGSRRGRSGGRPRKQ